jgi:hypothetical protein
MIPAYLIHYNQPEWCRQAVEAVLKSGDVAVTVVHNGGREPHLPQGVRLLRPGKNSGFTGGVNLALQEWLTGDDPWVLVGSHDLLPEPGSIDLLLAEARRSSHVGWYSLEMDAGTARGPIVVAGNAVTTHDWVSGACMLLRRQAVADVGLLDEDFRSYTEDVEYGLRMTKCGWEVAVVHAAKGRTLGSGVGENRAVGTAFGNHVLLDLKRGWWKGACRRELGFMVGAVRESFGGDENRAEINRIAWRTGAVQAIRWVGGGCHRSHVWSSRRV